MRPVRRVTKEHAEIYRGFEKWVAQYITLADLSMPIGRFVRVLHPLSEGSAPRTAALIARWWYGGVSPAAQSSTPADICKDPHSRGPPILAPSAVPRTRQVMASSLVDVDLQNAVIPLMMRGPSAR